MEQRPASAAPPSRKRRLQLRDPDAEVTSKVPPLGSDCCLDSGRRFELQR